MATEESVKSAEYKSPDPEGKGDLSCCGRQVYSNVEFCCNKHRMRV